MPYISILKQQVIGHQAVGVNSNLEFGGVFFQAVEIGLVILIGTKGLAPLIAADNDVIREGKGQRLLDVAPSTGKNQNPVIGGQIVMIVMSDHPVSPPCLTP